MARLNLSILKAVLSAPIVKQISMLALVFALFLRDGQLQGSHLPISRGFCSVNINGYNFSLSEMARVRGADAFFDLNSATYYVSICDELQSSEIGGDTGIDLTDAVVVKRNTNGDTSILAYGAAFDWRFYNEGSPNDGVVYYTQGSPFVVDSTQYTFDMEVVVLCDEESSSGLEPATFIFDDYSHSVTLKMRLSNAYGCPKRVSVPTPTPGPWEPNCRFVDRSTASPQRGVDMDLAELNEGPYGIPVPVTVAGNESLVFFQPCERSSCPLGYTCASDVFSSAWLCDKESRSCTEYGVVDAGTMTMSRVDPHDENSGVKVGLRQTETNSGLTNVYLTCDSEGFDNRINFFSANVNQGIITLNGTTKSACTTNIPIPGPPGEKCSWSGESTKGERVTLELVDLNKADEGWSSEITIESASVEAMLMYQPCGAMFCPADASCDGDEDATVWVCRNGAGGSQCIGYGLYAENVSMAFKDIDDATMGVVVSYYGSKDRVAEVTYVCGESLGEGELKIRPQCVLDGSKLSFTVESASVCTSPAPTPTREPTTSPTQRPTPTREPTTSPTRRPTPTREPTPTPTPVPSDNTKLPIGALFMLSVMGVFTLYVVIGVFVTFGRTGSPQFPNSGFWSEVWESVKYVFCCGRCAAREEQSTSQPSVVLQPLTNDTMF